MEDLGGEKGFGIDCTIPSQGLRKVQAFVSRSMAQEDFGFTRLGWD